LYISNGDGEAQEFNGRVAYLLEGFGFGVEFIDLRDEHREFLSRLLNSSAG
jgi:hypothetical protein